MKTMKWLLRREFWEHKGAMFWAPIAVGAAMILFVTIGAVYGSTAGTFHENVVKVTVNGQTTTTTTQLPEAFHQLPAEKKQQGADMVAGGYMAAGVPLFLILAAVSFFYCLACLHDERRDRSILFWKSLPVSDTETVLSKMLTAILVAPLITMVLATFVSILLLLIVGTAFALKGVNLFGMVLSNPRFYLAPLQLLGMLPVYALWALPTIGWLLMVSAWAKSKVFLWAVGVPLITVVIMKMGNIMLGMGIDVQWIMQNVIARFLLGVVPGINLAISKVDKDLLMHDDMHQATFGAIFQQSWHTLGDPGVWIGAAAGAAMVFAAIRLRRWKDEG